MTLGLVSNCWHTQLQAGVDLLDCIAEAHDRGYRWIELRQTCLGRFEAGDPPLPMADALEELPRRFADMRFNVAINVPFLNAGGLKDNPILAAGESAAQAVAGDQSPHLRLVDLATTSIVDSEMPAVTRDISSLAESMRERGSLLSIEQSVQSWVSFRAVFDAARGYLRDIACLRLCFDPVNLLNGEAGDDPIDVTRSLTAAAISMVHFKQRRNGRVLPRIDDGEVDWRGVVDALRALKYDGPFLFEVAPSANLWKELSASVAYLKSVGFDR